MKIFKNPLIISLCFCFLAFGISCNNKGKPEAKEKTDSVSAKKDTAISLKGDSVNGTNVDTAIKTKVQSAKTDLETPKILIYNFHITNRCVSCIAIEEATTKTLTTYFSKEMKSGIIKRQILNVDDKANKSISEKYEAFGSGLFVTRVFKGKETTTDLTGDGFKYAKNKEEKFIEILKIR